MVDIGVPEHTYGLSNEGYLVSHISYGRYPYSPNTDSTLKLTSVTSANIAVHFERFDLEGSSTNCFDYLQIGSGTQICHNPSNQTIAASSEISFKFVADSSVQHAGFWLSYRGG